jgi:hypothetical protein
MSSGVNAMWRSVKAMTGRKDNIEVRIERRKETQMVHIPVHETAQDVAAAVDQASKDGKNSVPTCDEMATAKKFMGACMGVSGFSMTDDCAFHGDCYRRSMPLQIFDSITENDLINDSNTSPWMGYLWNSKEQRYEWLLGGFKTLNECQSSLERSVGTFSYTRPVGCAYAGNNLLRVRIMNALYGGANYTCIAESSTPAETEKIGMRYGPAIGPVPNDPNSWHCVDAPRNFETIKGPAYSVAPSRR